ncbi:ParA family protein [Pokkaliibacter sp. CJK22405]|uniref:ParA family protein n=1 Tax=Pokkaliibacter sp. CJK22405 TaxID=3384615 RepID=UPI0039854C0D
MKRVIFNQKGGVGKSSITVNLAAVAAASGRKVAVIDLDPQGNASQYLLGPDWVSAEGESIYDFFESTLSFRLHPPGLDTALQSTPYDNLYVVPAHPELPALHAKLEAKHKIYKLKEALDALEDIDDVFIDTPPALNFFSLSALVAADSCLVPFDCDEFAKQALLSLVETLQETQADHNPGLILEGVVVNQFSARAKLPQQIVASLEAESIPVCEVRLPSSVVMRESHQAHQPLVHFAPKHKLTDAFQALWQGLNSGSESVR